MKLILALVALGLFVACGGQTGDNTEEQLSSELSADLTCKKITVSKGSIGGGQSASGLATQDLSSKKDVWSKYVEFAPSTSATCLYTLPSGKDSSSVTNLTLKTNYRGPKKANMLWVFEAYDYSASAWVQVLDNGFASEWVWTAKTVALPAPYARFFNSSGNLKIRFKTSSSKDAAQLDLLTVGVSYSGSSDGSNSNNGNNSGDGGTDSSDAGNNNNGSDGGTNNGSGPSSIWKPTPGTSWQWQISGTLDTSLNVQMYDLDLFETSASKIAALKARGIKVICYFDTAYEPGRPDSGDFTSDVLGNNMEGWPGQKWVDIRSSVVRNIMAKRIALAAQKGCDGVEPDDIDQFYNDPGFDFTASDQIDFAKYLAATAHSYNLSVGLKNNLDQVKQLVSYFDFAINEECFNPEYDECDMLKPFISANKAVFQVEYGGSSLADSVCPKANALNFDTLIKNLDLDSWRISCR